MRRVGLAGAVVVMLCACNALLEIDDAILVRPQPEAGPPRAPLAFRVASPIVVEAERPDGTPLHVTLSEAVTDPPVSVTVSAAPPGLSAEPLLLAAGASEGDLVLRASSSIVSGDYSIVVTADRGGERASERVAVKVVASDFGVDDVLRDRDIEAITLGVGVDGAVYGVTATQVVRVVRGKTTEILRAIARPPTPFLPATVTADTLYYSTHEVNDAGDELFSTCGVPLDPNVAPSFGPTGCIDGVALASVHTFDGGDLLLASGAQELARYGPNGERRATFALPAQPGEALLLGYLPIADEVVLNPRGNEDGGTDPPSKVAPDGSPPSTFVLDPAAGLGFPACAGHGPAELALYTERGLAVVDGNGALVPSFGDAGVAPLGLGEVNAFGICGREPDGGFYVASMIEEAGLRSVTLSSTGAALATSPVLVAPLGFPRIVRAGASGHFVLVTTFEADGGHHIVRVRP